MRTLAGRVKRRQYLARSMTLAQLADAIRTTPRVLAVGARTKPRLSQVEGDATLVSTAGLSGIVEYDPSEFTFTALAGTPVREIVAALAERGQYLPFDPMLVEAGATLGGTVAAGLSGPGRFRFGGVRDFILGVRFIDGAGRVLRLGGKVVKNAAGFDLPKFFVGSLGRFGVLAEIAFKVFPRAAAFRTVRIPTDNAAEVMLSLANTRWELDALDYAREQGAVFARIGGPEAALGALTAEVLARFPSGSVFSADEADALWTGVREFRWAHEGGVLVKVALTPRRVPELCAALGGARIHVSAGGNVAYVSQPAFAPCFAGFAALTLRGDAPLFPGAAPAIVPGVKTALDPENRFPSL
jgi:glycolate oxidase FAD binding subunit